jgi:hypothetical protein
MKQNNAWGDFAMRSTFKTLLFLGVALAAFPATAEDAADAPAAEQADNPQAATPEQPPAQPAANPATRLDAQGMVMPSDEAIKARQDAVKENASQQ